VRAACNNPYQPSTNDFIGRDSDFYGEGENSVKPASIGTFVHSLSIASRDCTGAEWPIESIWEASLTRLGDAFCIHSIL
jgi:hypothetical protein